MVDVTVKLDTREIDRRVVEAAKIAEATELRSQLHTMFRDDQYGGKEGYGRMVIREKIEKQLEKFWDDEKFLADLDRQIPALVEKYLQEAIHEVAKHKARKLAFSQFNELMKKGKE